MDTIICGIKEWIKTNTPRILDQLNGPATKIKVDYVENNLSMVMPDSLRMLLMLHDGEFGSDWDAFLGNGNTMLGCEHMVKKHAFEKKIFTEKSIEQQLQKIEEWKEISLEGNLDIKGQVYPFESCSRWMPITVCNGDVFRYLDFYPAPGGIKGQVIEVDYECHRYEVLASSFNEMLASYLEDLKADKYEVSEYDQIELKEEYVEDPDDWPIPGWLKDA